MSGGDRGDRETTTADDPAAAPASDRRWSLAAAGLALVVAAPILARPWAAFHADSYRAYDWLEAAKLRWFARHSLLEDHVLPLWCPYLEGGLPSYAHPSDGTLGPFFLTTLVFGDVLGMKLDVIALAVVGTVGTYALARWWLDLAPRAAFVTAALFAVCGWLPSRVAVGFYESCWMCVAPLVLAMLIRGVRRRRLRSGIPWFVGAAALLAAAGVHMQLCLAFVLLQMALWSVAGSHGWRGSHPILLGVVLAVTLGVAGLGAVKFAPMLDLLGDRGWRVAGVEEYEVSALEGIGGPLWGLFRTATPLGEYRDDGSPIAEYDYVGLPLLCVLLWPVALFARRRGTLPLVALAASTLLLAWSAGRGFQLSLFPLLRVLPVFSSMRDTAPYVTCFLALWSILLAGLGVEALTRVRWARRPPTWALTLLLVATLTPSAVRSGALYGALFTGRPEAPQETTQGFHHVRLLGPPMPGADDFNTAIYDHLRAGVGSVYDAEDLPTSDPPVQGRALLQAHRHERDNPDHRGELRLVAGRGTVSDLEPGANRLTFHATTDGPAVVELNHNHHPAWGSPQGYAVTNRRGLLAVEFTGAHDGIVELVFRPKATGLWISAASAAMALLLAWAGWPRRSRRAAR